MHRRLRYSDSKWKMIVDLEDECTHKHTQHSSEQYRVNFVLTDATHKIEMGENAISLSDFEVVQKTKEWTKKLSLARCTMLYLNLIAPSTIGNIIAVHREVIPMEKLMIEDAT